MGGHSVVSGRTRWPSVGLVDLHPDMQDFLDVLAKALSQTAECNAHLADEQLKKGPFWTRNPVVPFEAFVHHLFAATKSSRHVFVTAFIYVDSFAGSHPMSLGPHTLHKIFLGALLLANKMYDDTPFDNRTLALASGVPAGNLLQIELELSWALNFCLYISSNTFEAYSSLFDRATESVCNRKSSTVLASTEFSDNSKSDVDCCPLRSVSCVA
eukprot:NODE_946_length_1075_cov_540.357700_g670_i1.p1 GENE.NODE_946_length_1075_cov_540.357700_g670_i1~~NODE_946_length_1075_cov_540.357700_g670_i1.p1  ORF type:complete len:221 (+),score=15.97 NODE_946_length_1075_cov_540.357700_g670_i1:26-664(+)